MSTFQSPTLVDWSKQDFGIVRATYATRKDGKTTAHAQKIRAAGKVLGLYHFFLPKTDIAAQVKAFCEVADSVQLGDSDLLPCIDIEAYPDKFNGSVATHWAEVCKDWQEPLQRLIEGIEQHFGKSIMYITQRDWNLLGKPDWVLERPLWVAHYPRTGSTVPLAAPATPSNRPWAIWQQMVGPLGMSLQNPKHAAAVDQNIAVDPLPTIGRAHAHTNLVTQEQAMGSPIVESGIPWVTLSDDDWEEMRASRDKHISEENTSDEP